MPALPVSTAANHVDADVASRRRLHDLFHGLECSCSDNEKSKLLYMAAPMVRYSKLPFRLLCKKWGADVVFTPMIIADGFNRSAKARDCEFSTAAGDRPLVVQFAGDCPDELAAAAMKAAPFGISAVDINCGCPQRWAMQEGIGAKLSEQPELVKAMILRIRECVDVPVSIKIRLCSDREITRRLIRAAEDAGVAWITVHGRTAQERTAAEVHVDDIRSIKEFARVPIIANGDMMDPSDITNMVNMTGVDGVMSARGLLSNPALFSGHATVPLECVQDYLELALLYGGLFNLHHHHFMQMLDRHLTRAERLEFNQFTAMPSVIDFFTARGWWPRTQLDSQKLLAETSCQSQFDDRAFGQ